VDLQGSLISHIKGTSCVIVRVPSEAPSPTHNVTPTIQMAGIPSGTAQVLLEDLFSDGNVPVFQTTSIDGMLCAFLPRQSHMLTL